MRTALRTTFLLLSFSLSVIAWPATASNTSGGWPLLENNNLPGATSAFRTALKSNPKDLDARQGLSLVEWMQDEHAADTDMEDVIAQAPSEPRSFSDWHLLITDFRYYDPDAKTVAFCKSLASNDSAPAEIRASALLMLADIDNTHGNVEAATKIWNGLGYLRNWKTIGPFDNVSKSGFKKRFEPETDGILLNKTTTGKNDLIVGWRHLPTVAADGTCSPGQYLGDNDSSVYYSATSVSAPSEQELVMWYSPTGASKVWINNKLVLVDDIYRNFDKSDGETFAVPIKLNAGENSVLIKSADDSSSAAGFLLRFTKKDGNTPVNLAVAPDKATGIPEASQLVNAVPSLVALAEKAPKNRINLDALAGLQTDYDDYDNALVTISKLEELSPKEGWVKWEVANLMNNAGQEDDYRTKRDDARALQPNNVLAQEDYFDDATTKLPADQQISELRGLLASHSKSPLLLHALGSAYEDQKLYQQCLNCNIKAYTVAPGVQTAEDLSSAYDAAGRVQDELAFDKKALSIFPGDTGLLDDEGSVLGSDGQSASAIAVYNKALSFGESSTEVYESIANVYDNAHLTNGEIAVKLKEAALRPVDASIRSDIADLYADAGQKSAAISYYQQAIALDPSQVDLRDKIRLLNGAKPVLDLVKAIPADTLIAAARKSGVADKGYATYIVDEGREVVYSDGATDCRFRLVAKINDHAAISSFSAYPFDVSTASSKVSNVHARLIKPTGKITYPDVDDDATEVDFPSLDVGDIIDIEYDVTDYQAGALAHNFWTNWYFGFIGVTDNLCQFSLITPKGLNFAVMNHGTVPQPTQTDIGNWTIRQWKAANLTPVPDEESGPGYQDTVSEVDLSTVPSWAAVEQWYSDLAESTCTPDDTISAKAQELTAGDSTNDQKIEHIVKFVRSIRYQSTPFRLSAYVPTDGKEVIRELYGDCKDKAALLCSMLGSIGIKSEMILLSPRSNGIREHLPSTRFDHAIARVETGNGWQWVDATADQMQYGCLPIDDQGVPTLVIDPATTGLTTSPIGPASDIRASSKVDMALSADGSAKGTFSGTFFGNDAWAVRSAVQQYGMDHQDQLIQAVVTSLLSGAIEETGKFDGVDTPDLPLSINVAYHQDSYGISAGSLMLVKLPWNPAIQRIVPSQDSSEPRQTPIEVGLERGTVTETIHIALPAGYSIDTLEKPTKIVTQWGECDINYVSNSTGVTATRVMRIDPLRIPESEAAGFAAFLKDITTASAKQIVLKSTT